MARLKMTGRELREIRRRVRMKQDQLGEVIGYHFTTISDWERADAPVPHCVALIATLLDTDPVTRDKIEKLVELQS